MNIVNLYEYIKNWLILRNFEKKPPFDLVVYESFDNNEVTIHPKIKLKTLDDLWYEFGISWVLSWLSNEYKNILFIIDKLNYIYLIPFLRNLWKNKVTIINLWAGISGHINKWNPDMEDIWVLTNFNINIYEPYDFVNFFDILNNKENNYIRIANKELPMNLFWEKAPAKSDIVSLREFELSWDKWTIITTWYMSTDIINAASKLKEKWKNYDIFLLSNYRFQLTDELKNSIKNTENLIIFLDQNTNSQYINYIKSQLLENEINTKITVFYPKTDWLGTILVDHIFSECNFDSDKIYKNLSNI